MPDIGIPPQLGPVPNPGAHNRKLLFVIVGCLFLVLLSLILFLAKDSLFGKPDIRKPAQEGVLARVGEENIYKEYLDFELKQYPRGMQVDQKAVLGKIVTDSVLLQEAGKQNLVTLDQTIFNSKGIDYLKRVAAVQKASEQLEGQAETISGSVLSIYFVNGEITPEKYEANKKVALAKITGIHNQVTQGQINFDRAVEKVKSDQSLKALDPVFKDNAVFDFQVGKDEPIVRHDEFNNQLWDIEKGDISRIYTGQATNQQTFEKVDAFYFFAIVKGKNLNPNIKNFDQWVSNLLEQYEVIYY